ncbi:MAG TPA: PqqD family protein [Candidatus Acidoferrales bacterium]|nr:PqqD family protein [Candidatus Acidoferrales bacterium]
MSEKYIARSTGVAARMLDGEMIVMNVADSSLYTLNEQATAIWQAADGVTPLREIVGRVICREFEVDPETAYRDAERMVADLAAHGVLLVSEAPIG